METRKCEITGQSFVISAEEIEAYRYFDLPLPAVCPEERYRRQLAFRNEEQFFWRNCDRSKKKVYSIFPPGAPFPVISPNYWQSDNWDATEFGVEFDFSRPFSEQLLELWRRVPRPAYYLNQAEQSAAVHDVRNAKSSFMTFSSRNVSYCGYSAGLHDCSYCVDCYYIYRSERCYECVHCTDSSGLCWSEFCRGCRDSWFLSNCENCSNCMFSTNLKDKEFYIFNKPVTPEVYRQTLAEWNFTARTRVEEARAVFENFLAEQPLPHIIGDGPEDNSGNYLFDCFSAFDTFECSDCSNLVHCHALANASDCLDGYGYGDGLTRSVQFVNVGSNADNVVNSIACRENVSNLTYCSDCTNSSDLFACVGLRGKQYCIFNKQYSQKEYFQLRDNIIRHLKAKKVWGKFFSANFSAYPYNLSSAGIYMPLGKVQAQMLGFSWDEGSEIVRPSQLLGDAEIDAAERFADVPERLEEADEDTTRRIFLCELSGRPFRLTAQELECYRLLGVALPNRSFEQRHEARVRRLGPRRLQTKKSPTSGRSYRTSFPDTWRRPVLHYREWERAVRPLR